MGFFGRTPTPAGALVLAVSLFLVLSSVECEFCDCRSRTKEFTYYLYTYNAPPLGPSSVFVAREFNNNATLAPNTTSGEFGDVIEFNSMLRLSSDPYAPIVGRASGQGVKMEPGYTFLIFSADFNTTELNGSLAGQARFSYGTPTREFAVTGGTGDFRNAKGYMIGRSLPIIPNNTEHISVLAEYNVTLTF